MLRLADVLKSAMWLSLVSGIFLAFGWPFAVSRDPGSDTFRVLATATLLVFLAALVGLVILRAVERQDIFGMRG